VTSIIADKYLSASDRAAKQRAPQCPPLTDRHVGLLARLFAPTEPHAGRPQCLIAGPSRAQKGRQR
jgi:hypothetical protein